MPTSPTCASPKCTNRSIGGDFIHCHKHAYATGNLQPRINPTMARQHLQKLTNAGATIHSISAASGIDRNVISHILNNQSKTIRQKTHRKLMAVTPAQTITSVPAWQIARRIRALRAAGWQMQEIASKAGVSRSALNHILRRNTIVHRDTALRIRDAYTQLAAQPVRPPTPWVSRQHWAKPMEWDDIDDPEEQRDGVALGRWNPTFVTASRVKPDEALHAKLEDLHAHYGTQKDLADALGYHPSSIAHHMNRESKTIDVDVYVHIMNHTPDQKENAA